MSTNYFLIKQVSEEEKIRVCEKVFENLLDAQDYLRRLISNSRIHIGKYSTGWQFIFNHHNWQYFDTIERFKNFIASHKIVDEYEREISLNNFWNLVESSQNGINNRIYYTRKLQNDQNVVFINDSNNNYYEIYQFGYRFSTATDFC